MRAAQTAAVPTITTPDGRGPRLPLSALQGELDELVLEVHAGGFLLPYHPTQRAPQSLRHALRGHAQVSPGPFWLLARAGLLPFGSQHAWNGRAVRILTTATRRASVRQRYVPLRPTQLKVNAARAR